MSPLAFDIYAILRNRVALAHPEVSCAELVGSLPSPFNELDADSPLIETALEELTYACLTHGLPPITAMVVQANDEAPSSEVEMKQVRTSSYPPAL
jgi:hypothetical protein